MTTNPDLPWTVVAAQRDEAVRALEETLAFLRPVDNGFPRNGHCARSRLREALARIRALVEKEPDP